MLLSQVHVVGIWLLLVATCARDVAAQNTTLTPVTVPVSGTTNVVTPGPVAPIQVAPGPVAPFPVAPGLISLVPVAPVPVIAPTPVPGLNGNQGLWPLLEKLFKEYPGFFPLRRPVSPANAYSQVMNIYPQSGWNGPEYYLIPIPQANTEQNNQPNTGK